MLQLRIAAPADLTPAVLETLSGDPAVSDLASMPGASLRPAGDVVVASVAREAANDLIDQLHDLEVHERGSLQVSPVDTWMSEAGLAAQELSPGSSADTVVWAQVAQRAYEDSETNWTFLSLISLATLIAGIAIVLDSQILVIGAMVIGPEFGAIVALGFALVRRRFHLFGQAARALVLGFALAIGVTTLVALAGRGLHWLDASDITAARSQTDFIYSPDKWSVAVAVIAASAGVLALTSARVSALSGVFISVTTIPAAANVALGIAFGLREEITGSLLQLLVNISAMTVAGWLTLAAQQTVWRRASTQRARFARRFRPRPADRRAAR